MNVAIVYTSKTGNTEVLCSIIRQLFFDKNIFVKYFPVERFPISKLTAFDAVIIGTYTWGKGEIPKEMRALYSAFETGEVKHIITGVVGTGDSGYANFCGAVDRFRDMLYVQSTLAVTLKVELLPQNKDIDSCVRFVEKMIHQLHKENILDFCINN